MTNLKIAVVTLIVFAGMISIGCATTLTQAQALHTIQSVQGAK